MLLASEGVGTGSRVAVLLYGMMSSAESWWRVAPRLAVDGYRVVSVDLPGHGLSPRDPALTFAQAAAAVMTLIGNLDGPPDLVVGHSYGGVLLGAVASQLADARMVFVDAPLVVPYRQSRDVLLAKFEASRRARTLDRLALDRPFYGVEDREVEARAAERFDPATTASALSTAPSRWLPPPGSLVIRAGQSGYITEVDVALLSRQEVTVRSIAGAAHSVWYSHFAAFMEALEDW